MRGRPRSIGEHMTEEEVAYQEWTPCEMHGHRFEDGICLDCGEKQDPKASDAI